MAKFFSRLVLVGAISVLLGLGINNAYAAAPSSAPVITTQPVSVTVTAPATATFKVAATGKPAPTYQWEQEAPGGSTFTSISGATSASYTTPATTTDQSGTQYECVVTNTAGSVTSNAATLTVNPAPIAPTITTQPASITVTATLTATFTLAATGTPTPTYQWKQEASGARKYTAISGATSASYTTPATTLADSGTKYECVVTNVAGSVTSAAATLTVTAPIAPSITTQPVNATVTAPATATFTVVASGAPTPTYQWQQEAPGGSSYTTISGATSASYTTPATTAANSGTQYECVVTNVAGSVTSNPAILTVTSAPVVTITNPINNSTLTAGSNLTITASASETNGTISRVSFYNGSTLLGTSNASPYSYTATTLRVGIYNFTATATDVNGVSTTSSPVTVTVNGQPVVSIASPANQITLTTGSVNITAIASENYGAISNVAFYNGTTLLGKVASTSQAFTYSWTNIPAGTYNLTAVATDVIGATVTSSPITITINSSNFSLGVDDNIATKTDALNHTTSYQYDNLNRLLKTTFADGSTVSSAYDLFGNQISVTDQRGNILTKTYDAYERLAQTKDPLGGITQFNYDTEGRLLTLTDANGHATTYSYDPNGKVLTQTNALNFTIAFAYDPSGNIATKQDANGKTMTYTYDALNRLTKIVYPDGTSVAYGYDGFGNKNSMTDATGQTTYAYDALNRLLTKKGPADPQAISYGYDSEGNRVSITDQNNRPITNTFDALNRLATVTAPNGLTKYGTNATTTYGYDAVSNRISTASPNGVTENYTYDALNRVLTAVNATSSATISSFSNVHDAAGMITTKTYADGSWTTYSYDALNRLLEEKKQTSASIIYDYVYTYDPAGNRLTWTNNGNVRSYNYDAANRLTYWSFTANGTTQTDSYTYDNNGNRTAKQVAITGQLTQQTSYAYDFENRLDQLSYSNVPGITGTQTDSLVYNGESLRVQAQLNAVVTNYLYDGMNVVLESDASHNINKSYNRGLDTGGGIGSLITQNYTSGSTAVTQYYNYNDLGFVANLTTTSGTAAQSYSYDAFGNLLTAQAGGDTNRYLFSTKELDSRSGLDYFGGRYYDPEIGRWLTPDPLGFVNGPNEYAYCLNNPVNCVDPYGLFAERLYQGTLGFLQGIQAAGPVLNNFGMAALMTGVVSGQGEFVAAGAGIITFSGVTVAASGVAQGYLTGNTSQIYKSAESGAFGYVSGKVTQGIKVYPSSVLNTANQSVIGSATVTIFDNTYGYAGQGGNLSDNNNNS